MRGLRVRNKELRARITYATDAAELIKSGYKVGMSGFTGSGYPKLVPQEVPHQRHDRGLHQQRA
jgi:succinyl-CoA:acetate CoA-transferase